MHFQGNVLFPILPQSSVAHRQFNSLFTAWAVCMWILMNLKTVAAHVLKILMDSHPLLVSNEQRMSLQSTFQLSQNVLLLIVHWLVFIQQSIASLFSTGAFHYLTMPTMRSWHLAKDKPPMWCHSRPAPIVRQVKCVALAPFALWDCYSLSPQKQLISPASYTIDGMEASLTKNKLWSSLHWCLNICKLMHL